MSQVKGILAQRGFPGAIGLDLECFTQADADRNRAPCTRAATSDRFYQQGIEKHSPCGTPRSRESSDEVQRCGRILIGVLETSVMLSELEAFAREWEAAEQSRHARLLEQLKRECRESPRDPTLAEVAIDVPYSLRLPQSIPRQQVKPSGRSRSGNGSRSPRAAKE